MLFRSSLGCTATFLYPLLFAKKLRDHRADYEFRLMHWFPHSIIQLWVFLELLTTKFPFLVVLRDGLFSSWSLPLVAVGFLFLVIFTLHVIRRQVLRLTLLSMLFVPFLIGSLQTFVSPTSVSSPVLAERTGHAVRRLGTYAMSFVRVRTTIDSHGTNSTSIIVQQNSNGVTMTIASSRGHRLPSSGPALSLILFGFLGASTFFAHRRLQSRLLQC